jgi:hypothetical protein
LQSVADSTTAAQQKFYPGANAVTTQRISDWSRGKSVPRRFESVETMLKVLIGEARKKGTPPAMPGMYDLQRWRQWWQEARTASDDATGRPSQIPSPVCPYQGLAAFEATDQARFFGRARAVEELVAFIAKARAADPGIVLLTGPSGAGKSSLLSAGLIPAVSSGALDGSDGGWVMARMTPGKDPRAELVRCLDHPDVAGRADDARLLIVVDQGEQLFAPNVCPQSRAEFLDVQHTMSQPSTSAPGAVVVMGLRSDALGRCVEYPELSSAVQSRCMVFISIFLTAMLAYWLVIVYFRRFLISEFRGVRCCWTGGLVVG